MSPCQVFASVWHGIKAVRHTSVKRFQECPSPAKIQRQGWCLCTGSMLHIRTLVSSEAEAMTDESTGQVAKSLTSWSSLSCSQGVEEERDIGLTPP